MAEDQALEVQVIKGYELRELVAVGGQGKVYRAYQPVIDREVAVKVIQAEYANHPEFIRRFDSEAQLVARLEHLHIVPLFDFWREPDSAYLVMRWMRGGSLRNALANTGPWSLQAVVHLLDQIASALAVAHRNLVVHRDLKPDNILLDEENNAYLADFGIAKDIRFGGAVTERRDRMGSPSYMAPEQFLDKDVSPRTDIYSLGIVIYELLTGQQPFIAESTAELAFHHIQATVPPLQKYQHTLPVALNVVLWRATAKNPEDRYPDVLTFAREFRQFAADVEVEPVYSSTASTTGAGISQTLVVEDTFEPQNPYKGLRAFQEGDNADFFGREQFVERLLARLSDEERCPRFLALVGPSGSGKSSIMKAGLLPLLRRGALSGSQNWFYAQMVPGVSPLSELSAALRAVAPNPPADLNEQLRQSTDGLRNLVNQILPADRSDCCLLIDQFEEVFTQGDDEAERRWFLESLCDAVTGAESRVRLVITIRADFYDRPLVYSGFSELIRSGTEVVLPLQARELEYAIVGPAQRLYLRFEPGLVSRIIADVTAQPGSLPLLQYALTELFERRAERSLTNAAYEAIQGVSGALAQRAEDLYQSLSRPHQEAAQRLMLRLVAVGEEGEPTRRRILQSELLSAQADAEPVREVMESFGRFRLVTFDHHRDSREPTVELAHEALISAWKRLREWITGNAELLRIQRRFSNAAAEWNRAGRERSFLAGGARLVQFEALSGEPTITLSELERTYLDASIDFRQAGVRRLRLFIAALASALLIAIVLALFAFQQRAEADTARVQADHQAKLSRSRELAALASSSIDQLDLSLLLSMEALKVANTFEARSSLLTALQAQPKVIAMLPGSDSIRAVAFSPDGQFVASAGRSTTITLWDADTHAAIDSPLMGHLDWINSLAFSPDGALLASASSDGTVRLWDVEAGTPVGEPLGDAQVAQWAVAFSTDGTLASAGADGTIRLWDTPTGTLKRPPLTGHEDTIYSLAFSPNGSLLASGSGDGTVRLWDAATGEELHRFNDHTNWVLSVAFSPDGLRLASSGADEQIVIWDTRSYEMEASYASGQNDWVRGLAYSPDGTLLASASQDGSTRIWDSSSGSLVGEPLIISGSPVWSAAFRPSAASELVSGDASGSTILWNLDAEPFPARTRIRAGEPITSLTFAEGGSLVYSSGNITTRANENTGLHLWRAENKQEQSVPGGQRGIITDLAAHDDTLVSASSDGTLYLWDLRTMEPIRAPFAEDTSGVSAVAYSPDGRTIASGNQRGIVLLWDAATGTLIGEPLTGHEDTILSLAFSPDGKMLASGSRDITIKLWNVDGTPALVQTLTGHQDAVSSVSFSPDGTMLASGSYDRSLRLWDTRGYLPIGQPMIGHEDEVWSVAFSPDGQMLAGAGRDNLLRLWDVAARQPIGRPALGHADWITHLAFSPDGALLATGSLDSSLVVWGVSLEAWIERACTIANRDLTPTEWARYFPDVPYHETCSAPTS